MLTGGSVVAWVTASAVSVSRLAADAAMGRKAPRGAGPPSALAARHRSRRVPTREVTQPSVSIPRAL